MVTYFSRHLQVMLSTFGTMCRTPMASFNTTIVVAVAILLPGLLYVAIKSGQALNENWQGRPQISIFMQQSVSVAESKLIFDEIRLHPMVELAELVSPEQGLAEFKALSGMDFQLDFLGDNPIPRSIVVMPNQINARSEKLLELQQQLSKIEGIEQIRLDLDWTDRFNAILRLVTRSGLVLSALLALALILIVGNTIKLLILNRRQEIEITKLVGGTDSFVRRPFLYYGWFYGLFGAFIALLLLWGAGQLLRSPLHELAELYDRKSLIYGLKWYEIAAFPLVGSTIGWFAARWSVARHLKDIQPR